MDFWKGNPPHLATKTSGRFTADGRASVFKNLPAGTITLDAQATTTNDLKKPFLYYAYDAKTEEDSLRPGQFLSRLNPSAPLVDFGDLSDAELDALPFEIHVRQPNSSSALNQEIDQLDGRGYFGGGTTGTAGSTFISSLRKFPARRGPTVWLWIVRGSLESKNGVGVSQRGCEGLEAQV